MQDPSHGVVQPLQGHVHLISGHRFPLLPSFNIDQAFRYLIDAPTIVKQTAPMSWNYVQAPQDGTVWLEWIPPRNGERFPSDGYVWGDPESSFPQQFGGYTVEMMQHTVGYRPRYDHMASHARTRYHFLAKNPNTAGPLPDPNLWIVHYHQTEQPRMIPSAQLPVGQQMREIMSQRSWLESQGRLERKDFMLHDREHWPTISLPTQAHMPQQMQQSGLGMNAMLQQQMAAQQQRYPQYPYPQGAGGPPAKRPRHSGPTALPGSSDGVHDTSIEDEENTSLGDFFDHLSPREISMARYMQHHRWMEEVFSSPYASSQIVPPDLGLGLMGELKGLTDGILAPPSLDEIARPAGTDKPAKAKEAPPFTNLKKEQIEEFNRRVQKHLEDGRAEIEAMKKAHADKMAEWKKTKTLVQAEKRLRNATWEGHESALPQQAVSRAEVPEATNGHAVVGSVDGAQKAAGTVEDVVRDVESLLGVRIGGHKDAMMVEKGGLEKEELPAEEEMVAQQDDDMGQDNDVQDQVATAIITGNGGMAEPLQVEPKEQASLTPQTNAQTLAEPSPGVPGEVAAQPTFDGEQAHLPPAPLPADAETNAEMPMPGGHDLNAENPLDDLGVEEDMDMGDASLMDMDVDVDDVDDAGGIDFGDGHPEGDGVDNEILTTLPGNDTLPEVVAAREQGLEILTNVNDVHAESTGSATLASGTDEQMPTEQPALAEQQPVPAPANAPTATTEEPSLPTQPANDIADISGPTPVEGDNSMFDDGTFDDLPNMDGAEGDDGGLLDFEGGMEGMDGMEDSFGDALHGMDTPGAMMTTTAAQQQQEGGGEGGRGEGQ